MKLHHWKLKVIRRWSPSERIYRLLRIIWQRGTVGDGKGYSAMFTVSFCKKLFSIQRDQSSGLGFYFILLGLRIHFQKAMGGIHS